jgi:hypothetical protein
MKKQLVVKKNRLKNCGELMLLLVMSIFVLSGCTHSLHITNLDEHVLRPVAPLKEPVKVGVSSSNEMHPLNGRYVNAIVDALKHNGSIEHVVYPYSRATTTAPVDVLVDIAVNPKYDGKGSNFFVSFPGFIIFAPAIWGFGYEARIDTQVSMTNLKTNVTQQIAAPANYSFRHADFDRTWTEVGWFEVGIIPLIGGIVFTGYDSDITDLFISKVSSSYGPFIANKIMDSLPPNTVTQAGQEPLPPAGAGLR